MQKLIKTTRAKTFTSKIKFENFEENLYIHQKAQFNIMR